MNVLVAGASGLIGREVVRLLKQRGHAIRTLSSDRARANKLASLVDDVRVADAANPRAIDGICDGIEIVISALGAAVSPSAKGRRSFGEVDRVANLALLADAKRAGVRRYVYVSVFSCEVYEQTAYVRAHVEVEAAIRAAKLEYGFVRPTGVFGAFVEMIGMAKKGFLPLIGNGSAPSNPVHESDVAEAAMRAFEAPASTEIDLGGPEVLTRRQIAELAFAAIGKRARFISMPAWLMRMGAKMISLFNRRIGEFIAFLVIASTNASVAPAIGTKRLAPYLAEHAGDRGSSTLRT